MRVLTATIIGLILGFGLFTYGYMLGDDTTEGRIVLGACAFSFLFVLRCPRCWALSWMSRGIRGRFGMFFQYPVPPSRCGCCGLDFRKHNLFEKIGWE